jgi:hypothetical protein
MGEEWEMGEITIGGVPMRVVSMEEAEAVEAVICMRVADLPIPPVPSSIERCGACDARVWVSSTSPRRPRRLCLDCGHEAISPD